METAETIACDSAEALAQAPVLVEVVLATAGTIATTAADVKETDAWQPLATATLDAVLAESGKETALPFAKLDARYRKAIAAQLLRRESGTRTWKALQGKKVSATRVRHGCTAALSAKIVRATMADPDQAPGRTFGEVRDQPRVFAEEGAGEEEEAEPVEK